MGKSLCCSTRMTQWDRLPACLIRPQARWDSGWFSQASGCSAIQYGFFSDTVRQYGDIVGFHLQNRHLFVLNHPDYIRHVLRTNHENYRRGESLEALYPLLGQGLFLSRGAFWRRHRQIMTPAFARQHLEYAAGVIREETITLLEAWQGPAARNQPLDVEQEMKRLSFRILFRTMINTRLKSDTDGVIRALNTVLEYASLKNHLTRLIRFLILQRYPAHPARVRRAVTYLDGVVFDAIRACREDRTSAGLLLAMLLNAYDDGKIDERQIRDELIGLLFAGFDTVAEALAWTWYLLAKHPDIDGRVYEEAHRVLAGRLPVFDAIPRLTYTRMVIEEALRLYPPAWAFHRMADAEDAIGGYAIPKDSYVMICPYALHRHPAFWKDPETFRPERFDPAHPEAGVQTAYIPFGDGPHTCLGTGYAVAQMPFIAAMIAQRYRLRMDSGMEMRPREAVILRPRTPMRMRAQERV